MQHSAVGEVSRERKPSMTGLMTPGFVVGFALGPIVSAVTLHVLISLVFWDVASLVVGWAAWIFGPPILPC
ncbi:MAG: hypothetical protein ACYTHK_12290 [Planctomycetota bacterium]